ncbi:MAG: extracellular solute-binding protein [Oscillibacter sp.]|nr:extracellular solute-binding protein [Oscillibacter sp.]
MKRLFATLLALSMALSLAACGAKEEPAASAPAASSSAAPSEPAAPEISGTLVVCSSATDQDLAAIEEGFTALYPDVELEFITCSAGEGVARVQAEGDNPTIDVFYSGLNQADGDKYAGIFEPYVSIHDGEMPEQYQSNNGFYNYDHLSSVVFCVNTDLEAELGMEIDSYEDLLDPRLEGKVILSDPTSSSSAWNNMANIFAVFGNDSDAAWAQIEGMLQNGLIIVGSSSACFKSVQQGEYVVGLTSTASTTADPSVSSSQRSAERTQRIFVLPSPLRAGKIVL